MGLFDTGHVAKLHEIQSARLRAGQEGIGAEVEDLIRRLEMGGINQRRIQAKRLWDKGFGREIGAKHFKAYLAGIPEIPETLVAPDADLPLLSLADPRPGLLKVCWMIGIRHRELGHSEGDAVPLNERHTDPTEPFWFRHDDGRKNRNRRPDTCRDECIGYLLAGTAMTGAFAYLHHSQIVEEGEYGLDLPGSVHRSSHLWNASLWVWGGNAKLSVTVDSRCARSDYGSLRVRRK